MKVGFSMTEVVLVSSDEVDEDSTASSESSARTWPRRVAEEQRAAARTAFTRILSICLPKQDGFEIR